VWAGRSGDHVQDTLPHLVETIKAGAASALEQWVEPGCGGV